MKKILFLLLWVLFCAGGCAFSTSDKTYDRTVSVSILPLKYVVDRISGGDFDVTVLVPPGSSPETYEPTMSQMKDIARSKAYFQIGLLDFERPFARTITDNSPDVRLIDLSPGLSLLEGICGHDPESHHHGIDPHIWLSPARVKRMAGSIGEILMEIQPDSAEKYRINLNDFISSVDSIDLYIQNSFSDIDNKKVLIFHPFLTYYADDYNVDQIAVEQEGKEPSAAQLKSLIKTIRQNELNTVFYQRELHRHSVDALLQETGIKAVAIDPLAYDWVENMNFITEEMLKSWNH